MKCLLSDISNAVSEETKSIKTKLCCKGEKCWAIKEEGIIHSPGGRHKNRGVRKSFPENIGF